MSQIILKAYFFYVISIGYIDIKNEIQDLTIDMTPDDEAAFRKLSVRRVKTVYSSKDVGYALIKKFKLENIRYAGEHKMLYTPGRAGGLKS